LLDVVTNRAAADFAEIGLTTIGLALETWETALRFKRGVVLGHGNCVSFRSAVPEPPTLLLLLCAADCISDEVGLHRKSQQLINA
jgi:hypothetical protein